MVLVYLDTFLLQPFPDETLDDLTNTPIFTDGLNLELRV